MLNYSAPGWKCSFKLNAQAFRCLVLVIHCINPHLCATVLEHFALPKQQLFLKGPEKKSITRVVRKKNTSKVMQKENLSCLFTSFM